MDIDAIPYYFFFIKIDTRSAIASPSGIQINVSKFHIDYSRPTPSYRIETNHSVNYTMHCCVNEAIQSSLNGEGFHLHHPFFLILISI